MNLLRSLFGLKTKTEESLPQESFSATSGDHITQISHGSNLVDGKPTWEHAESGKDNLEVMLKCCEAELKTMKVAKVVAAPYYFERAAILLRKAKQYDHEIELCERYVHAVESYYSSSPKADEADVRKGPRFKAIEARVSKAKLLRERAQ